MALSPTLIALDFVTLGIYAIIASILTVYFLYYYTKSERLSIGLNSKEF
jgi:hypothetical protein